MQAVTLMLPPSRSRESIRPSLLLFATLLVNAPLAAQSWQPDPNAQRLAWGTANVVLQSDTTEGLTIYAATSKVMKHSVPQRSFAARFDPDSVVDWLAYAQRLLEPSKGPSVPKARLQTPALLATDSSTIVIDRAAEGSKWSNTVSLVFTAPDNKSGWSIATRPEETRAFLTALQRSAAVSFYLPDADSVFAPNPADTLVCPRPLAVPKIHYPSRRQAAGQQGDVWLTYVVRADSTVDPASIRVLVSDGADFTEAAAKAVTSVRYQPAQSSSGPRDARAFQRISFLLR